MSEDKKAAFEEAGRQRQLNLPTQFFLMLRHNKKYWMIPLIFGLLCLGLLVMFGSSVAAPFIYALF
jgi:hypothetical protein